MFSGNMLTNYYKRDILDAVKSDMKILGVKFYKVTRKNKKNYRKTLQKESEPFDVPAKNVKSRTTAKVSVLHRTNHQANVNILKANLGTLFL